MENHKDQSEQDIKDWIEKISESRPELNGFAICPYSKNSNYKIVKCEAENITIEKGYDVIIYIITESNLYKINNWVEFYNNKFKDWIFFEDCANYNTFINGVQTNNGKHNLILAQPKDKLIKFREALKKTDYYSFWSKEYYNEIVGD